MVKIGETVTQQPSTIESTIISRGTKPTPADLEHMLALLTAATRAAINGALTHGVDMPVGAAISKNGRILSTAYAQDNLLHDKSAHAERMAVQHAHQQFPGIEPDTIAVTLEPCNTCQDYLATISGLRRVVYALPTTVAESHGIVRPKDKTIFERDKRDKFPYQVIQANNEQLSTIGKLLFTATSRDIDTGETSVDPTKLHEHLPAGYLPITDTPQ